MVDPSKQPAEGDWCGVVREKLEEMGIDLDRLCGTGEGGAPNLRMVCVAPDLGARVRELGLTPRDQVVMVRVDEETCRKLDAWVETGAVRSRSEAAALFIKEGLQVRAAELDRLESALKKVERAKADLRRKAKEVFGESGPGDSPEEPKAEGPGEGIASA